MRTCARCLVLDHFTLHERHLADLVGRYFAVQANGYGEHHVGRVRITVELLPAPEADVDCPALTSSWREQDEL